MAKVQHIALIKFKPGTSQPKIAELLAALRGLQTLIPGLERFSGGPYSSPEGMNQGFTHGFVMLFTDAAARDRYLPHPEHERVKDMVLPYVENVVVFDFEDV